MLPPDLAAQVSTAAALDLKRCVRWRAGGVGLGVAVVVVRVRVCGGPRTRTVAGGSCPGTMPATACRVLLSRQR